MNKNFEFKKEVKPLFVFNKTLGTLIHNIDDNSRYQDLFSIEELNNFEKNKQDTLNMYKLIESSDISRLKRILKEVNSSYDVDNTNNNITLREYQIKDGLNLAFSQNKLIRHQQRLGKVYISLFGAFLRNDIRNIIIIANSSIISDLSGWHNSIIELGQDMSLNVNVVNKALYKKQDILINDIKEAIDNTLFDKNIILINPEFITTSNLGSKLFAEWSKKNDIIWDLGIFDEIHEMLKFDKRQLVVSNKAKKLIEFRHKLINNVWVLSGTAVSQSDIEIIGISLFVFFTKKNFLKHSQFNNIYSSINNPRNLLDSLFYIYRDINQYGSIDYNLIREKYGYDKVLNLITNLFSIERTQKDVNEHKKDLIINKFFVEPTPEQTQIYNKLSSLINEEIFIQSITSKIALITFQKEVSIDHRMLIIITKKRIEKLISVLNYKHDNVVLDIYFDMLIREILFMFNNDIQEARHFVKQQPKDTLKNVISDKLSNYFNSIPEMNSLGGKIKWIIDFINNFEFKTPLLIFSHFSSFFETFLINDIINNTNISRDEIGVFTGKTSSKEKSILLQEFYDGKKKILLLQTKASATGLTLSKANDSIYLDIPWRYIDFSQSIARIDDVKNTSISKTIHIPMLKLTNINNDDIESIDEYIHNYIENNRNNIKKTIKHID